MTYCADTRNRYPDYYHETATPISVVRLLMHLFHPGTAKPQIPSELSSGIDALLAKYTLDYRETNNSDAELTVTPDILGDIYESLLSINQRKKQGVFYTPAPVVETMCRDSLKQFLIASLGSTKKTESIKFIEELLAGRFSSPGEDKHLFRIASLRRDLAVEVEALLKRISILDPSAGAGGYVMAMLRLLVSIRIQLLTLLGQDGETDCSSLIRDIIEHNLYGIDLDPVAVEITRFRLMMFYLSHTENPGSGLELDLNHISVKDALLDTTQNEIEQKYDIYIGNPPYERIGFAYNALLHASDQGKKLQAMTSGGKSNLYQLFYALGLQLLKPNGVLSLLVPAAFLADKSNRILRKEVLENTRIVSVKLFEERDNPKTRLFKSAKMSTCIITAVNSMSRNMIELYRIQSMDSRSQSSPLRLKQSYILQLDPKQHSIPLFAEHDKELVEHIVSRMATRLDSVARCHEGEINLTLHKQYLQPTGKGNSRLIKGAAVQRYRLLNTMSQGKIMYLDHESYLRENTTPKSGHHQNERIVMQGITGVNEHTRLKLTLLNKGIFCANSTNYILLTDRSFSIYYLLGLLNSRLYNWYFRLFSTNSNVNTYEINNLPLPKRNTKIEKKIISSVTYLLNCDSTIPETEQATHERLINESVYSLFSIDQQVLTSRFPDGINLTNYC